MGSPKPKAGRPDPYLTAFEKDFLKEEPGAFFRAVSAVRSFWLKLLLGHRRKHPRLSLQFSDPLLVRLDIGGEKIDAAPADLSLGGMGIEVPEQYLTGLEEGQVLSLLLSFDGKSWQEAQAEIRYLLPSNAIRGYVGVQFRNPGPALLTAIESYNKLRPGKI